MIWADIAERTFENPIIGVGARTTNELNARGTASLTQSNAESSGRSDAILTTFTCRPGTSWAAVGAILLGMAGLVAFTQSRSSRHILGRSPWRCSPRSRSSSPFAGTSGNDGFSPLCAFSAVVLVLALRWVTLQMSRGASGGSASAHVRIASATVSSIAGSADSFALAAVLRARACQQQRLRHNRRHSQRALVA